MITGGCPYCNHLHLWDTEGAEYGRQFAHPTCQSCGKRYWIFLTQAIPYAQTEEDFAEIWIVDDETHRVRRRNPPPPLTETQQVLRDIFVRSMGQALANDIIGVTPTTPSDDIKKRIERWRAEMGLPRNPDSRDAG